MRNCHFALATLLLFGACRPDVPDDRPVSHVGTSDAARATVRPSPIDKSAPPSPRAQQFAHQLLANTVACGTHPFTVATSDVVAGTTTLDGINSTARSATVELHGFGAPIQVFVGACTAETDLGTITEQVNATFTPGQTVATFNFNDQATLFQLSCTTTPEGQLPGQLTVSMPLVYSPQVDASTTAFAAGTLAYGPKLPATPTVPVGVVAGRLTLEPQGDSVALVSCATTSASGTYLYEFDGHVPQPSETIALELPRPEWIYQLQCTAYMSGIKQLPGASGSLAVSYHNAALPHDSLLMYPVAAVPVGGGAANMPPPRVDNLYVTTQVLAVTLHGQSAAQGAVNLIGESCTALTDQGGFVQSLGNNTFFVGDRLTTFDFGAKFVTVFSVSCNLFPAAGTLPAIMEVDALLNYEPSVDEPPPPTTAGIISYIGATTVQHTLTLNRYASKIEIGVADGYLDLVGCIVSSPRGNTLALYDGAPISGSATETIALPSPRFVTTVACDAWADTNPLTSQQMGMLAVSYVKPEPPPLCLPVSLCVADCNGDGVVTVDEIIRAVSIDLGEANVSTCSAADRDGNGQVSVDELLAAVQASLNGCK